MLNLNRLHLQVLPFNVLSVKVGGQAARLLTGFPMFFPIFLGLLVIIGWCLDTDVFHHGLIGKVALISIISTALICPVILVCRKFSQQKKELEKKLEKSKARCDTLLIATDQVVFYTNVLGEVVEEIPAWQTLTGQSQEVYFGKGWLEAFHPNDLVKVKEFWNQAITSKRVYSGKHKLRTFDGNYRYFMFQGMPVLDERQEVREWIITYRDISERAILEQALCQSNERLQLLCDNTSDLQSNRYSLELIDDFYQRLSRKIGLDVYFHFLVADKKQALQLVSYSGVASEWAKNVETLEFGRGVCGKIAQDYCPIIIGNVQQSVDPRTELIRALGITAYYAQPLIVQGKFMGTIAFGSRSSLCFTQNEVALMQAVCTQIAMVMERTTLVTNLQEKTDELNCANQVKEEFLGILSHELRSPLHPILGWTQLLRSRKLSETQTANALETIEKNVKLQTQTIEKLLDMCQMNQGKVRLQSGICQLVPIIEAAVETIDIAAKAKQIEIETNLEGGVKVIGDTQRLHQIIWHLLSNAIKFSSQGGNIKVKLALSKDKLSPEAEIHITDTGVGINPEFIPCMFEPFCQADTSLTRQYDGLGVGLAISRHLVELHGGNIYAVSAGVGQGATFIIKLPAIKQVEKAVHLLQNRE
jgi:PAS domain S-box-containing protein